MSQVEACDVVFRNRSVTRRRRDSADVLTLVGVRAPGLQDGATVFPCGLLDQGVGRRPDALAPVLAEQFDEPESAVRSVFEGNVDRHSADLACVSKDPPRVADLLRARRIVRQQLGRVEGVVVATRELACDLIAHTGVLGELGGVRGIHRCGNGERAELHPGDIGHESVLSDQGKGRGGVDGLMRPSTPHRNGRTCSRRCQS